MPTAKEGAVRWRTAPTGHGGSLVLHVNTSPRGGGVAELLSRLVIAQSHRGYRVGWMVLEGGSEFFAFTKNLHHMLHGRGDLSLLGGSGARAYRETVRGPYRGLLDVVGPGDTVVLHDAQPLGMAAGLCDSGARVAWHCHVGSTEDHSGNRAAAWRFLRDDLHQLDAVAVARSDYLPELDDGLEVHTILPALDASAAKNRPMTADQARALWNRTGLGASVPADRAGCRIWQDGPVPQEACVVLQVSRWDPLKNMVGVLRMMPELPEHVHVVLAGPDPADVVDDPEGRRELERTVAHWQRLPDPERRRAHVLALPMFEDDTNALFVNALQRRADIVVQNSLEEGFGLTVAEAMFKGKPVVGTRVGGITLQIRHGHTGILVPDDSPIALAAAVAELASNPVMRNWIGEAARAHVAENFLIGRMVGDYEKLMKLGTG